MLGKTTSLNYGRPPSQQAAAAARGIVQRSQSHVNPGYANREPINAIVMPQNGDRDVLVLERSGPSGQPRLLSTRHGRELDEPRASILTGPNSGSAAPDASRSRAAPATPSPASTVNRPRLEDHEIMQHFALVRVKSAQPSEPLVKKAESLRRVLQPPTTDMGEMAVLEGWSHADSRESTSPLRAAGQPDVSTGVPKGSGSAEPAKRRENTAVPSQGGWGATTQLPPPQHQQHEKQQEQPQQQKSVKGISAAAAGAGAAAAAAGPVFGGHHVSHPPPSTSAGPPHPIASSVQGWRSAELAAGSDPSGPQSPQRAAGGPRSDVNPLTQAHSQSRALHVVVGVGGTAPVVGAEPERGRLRSKSPDPLAALRDRAAPREASEGAAAAPTAAAAPINPSPTHMRAAHASAVPSAAAASTAATTTTTASKPALPPRPKPAAPNLPLSTNTTDNRPLRDVLNDIASGKYNRSREIRDVVLFDAEFAAWEDQPGNNLLQGWAGQPHHGGPVVGVTTAGVKAGKTGGRRYKPFLDRDRRAAVQRGNYGPGDSEDDDSGLEEEEEEEE